jgi:hypothetical protein
MPEYNKVWAHLWLVNTSTLETDLYKNRVPMSQKTLGTQFKDHSLTAGHRNNCNLFWQLHETHNVRADITYSKHGTLESYKLNT